jgi:DGQHR domain-containing protein
MPKTAKKKKKSKKTLDPTELAQRLQKRVVRALFRRLGFERIQTDGVHFTFKGRTGEIDDLFVYQNILVHAEYTIGKNTSEHVFKKKVLFDLIETHSPDWVTAAAALYPRFKELVAAGTHAAANYQVRTVYLSQKGTSDEAKAQCPTYLFPNPPTLKYFEALSKAIHLSARSEFLKYLRIPFAKIGDAIHSLAAARKEFTGYLLPATFSSFPTNFKIVSFYTDPETLLATSYVLRKDSWMDAEGLYQRILVPKKIRNMRHYLTTRKRAFVNNIIATLPASTALNDPATPGKNLDPKELEIARSVVVSIPFEFDTVGIVDGQHRVFCYHEGADRYEKEIAKLRTRQNLLVTGIVYPKSYKDQSKREFEARLFLEINDTQTRAKAGLRQSIELILNPYSAIAVAKAVVQGLATTGPLTGLLQTNYFDPPTKIKTASMVTYGLRPLVKFDGDDSLFSLWPNSSKQALVAETHENEGQLLSEYVAYCHGKLNDLLEGARQAYGPARWRLPPDSKHNILSPTAMNGLFVCLRLLIQNHKVPASSKYVSKFAGIDSFPFGTFKSSQWRALGEKLFATFF